MDAVLDISLRRAAPLPRTALGRDTAPAAGTSRRGWMEDASQLSATDIAQEVQFDDMSGAVHDHLGEKRLPCNEAVGW